jgi:transposase
VADKGYHSRDGLKTLEDGAWKSRIAEPRRDGFLRWHGDDAARRAVYNNRARLLSEVARQAFRLRAELVERGFALILDRGGMRRTWLRGRENVHKRYLVHVAGYNLGGVTEGSMGLQGRWNGHGGLIMRLLTGAGTPREFLARVSLWPVAVPNPDGGLTLILLVTAGRQVAAAVLSFQPHPLD